MKHIWTQRAFSSSFKQKQVSEFFNSQGQGETLCPDKSTMAWKYASETGLVPDKEARLRCSDCNLFPSEPECGEKNHK